MLFWSFLLNKINPPISRSHDKNWRFPIRFMWNFLFLSCDLTLIENLEKLFQYWLIILQRLHYKYLNCCIMVYLTIISIFNFIQHCKIQMTSTCIQFIVFLNALEFFRCNSFIILNGRYFILCNNLVTCT